MNISLNDRHTIDIPIFRFGDAQAKKSMVQSISVAVIIFIWTNKNVTGYRFVNFYEFWVMNDEMALFQNSMSFFALSDIYKKKCVCITI